MAERKPFLLRIDPAILDALQKWAADDLRSLNAQIEFVLRRSLQQERRLAGPAGQRLPGPAAQRPAGQRLPGPEARTRRKETS